MPDTHDTEREIAIPEEAPTRPDLRVGTLQVCPRCHGEGRTLDVTEWETQHKAIAKVCGLCDGRRSVTAQQPAEVSAIRQGRPSSRT